MNALRPFHQRIYAFTRTIPRGETLTYGEVAAKLRATGSVHSVAQALAQNPFVIIVPCHRVVGSDGRLTGYGGGLWRKDWLLRHEGHDRLFV
jgi:O-6-methylguanine DNA methyltransferase